MKIKSLRASVHAVPLEIPLLGGKPKTQVREGGFVGEAFDGKGFRRQVVFCEVETVDGRIGCGLTGHFLPFGVVAALEKEFLPVVKGMDAREVEAIHNKLFWTLNPRAATGVYSSALSVLDLALWDIHGKAVGRTVAQLLGGAREIVPAYVTFGFPHYDREQLVEAARIQVGQGYKHLKMVVGAIAGGWQEDAQRIRLVREAIGSDIELIIDANCLFMPIEAKLLCQAVEDCNLFWFEEPLQYNDTRLLSELRKTTKIPIAAGQNEGHRWRLREFIEAQAVDILQPNCAYNGGYTETQKIAHFAQVYSVPIANGGGWPLFNMHTMAGLANGWLVEFHLGMQSVGETLFKEPPRPEKGFITIPANPGLGLAPNYENLNETKIV